MKLYKPEKIYIQKQALDCKLTHQILSRLPDVETEEIETARPVIDRFKQEKDPIGAGKRSLLLAYDQGRSFKPFPEAEQYLSCDYYTLHLAEGCDLECSYCILQAYLTNPMITLFMNIEEILANLQKILAQHPDQFFRIGTGQLADSLSLDHITGFTEHIVPFFAKQKNAILELKTKSTNIDRLLNLEPQGKSIISWSMNSKRIQEKEEHKCASLEERIEAAARVADKGYKLSFHFDPIIDYIGWEEEYEETFKALLTKVPHEAIAWISLGCLRMMPSLKPIMQDRFPKSLAPQAEWIRGLDGKLRYFKPRRVEIYKEAVARIRKYAPDVTLYLSMESPEVWRRVFGFEPTKESVCEMLDKSVMHD